MFVTIGDRSRGLRGALTGGRWPGAMGHYAAGQPHWPGDNQLGILGAALVAAAPAVINVAGGLFGGDDEGPSVPKGLIQKLQTGYPLGPVAQGRLNQGTSPKGRLWSAQPVGQQFHIDTARNMAAGSSTWSPSAATLLAAKIPGGPGGPAGAPAPMPAYGPQGAIGARGGGGNIPGTGGGFLTTGNGGGMGPMLPVLAIGAVALMAMRGRRG